MAQNITLQGASYTDVPAVVLPKTGGGTASFTDVSDTTATASDVLNSKYFYTSDGTKTQGTGTGSESIIRSLTVTPSSSEQTFTAVASASTYYESEYFNYNKTKNFNNPLILGQTYLLICKEIYPDSQGRVHYQWQAEFVAQINLTLVDLGETYLTPYVSTTQLQHIGSGSWEYLYEIYETQVDAYCPITVLAIPSNYIIPSGTFTISSVGTIDIAAYASVTVPAGAIQSNRYYSNIYPSISINPTTGIVTADNDGIVMTGEPVTTSGYIDTNVDDSIYISGSTTFSLTTQSAQTITPSTASQIAVASRVYTIGAITVAAIPSQYKDITGVTASAADVLSGKSFINSSGATTSGSLVVQYYYTGSTEPSPSLGNNGDIYLKMI